MIFVCAHKNRNLFKKVNHNTSYFYRLQQFRVPTRMPQNLFIFAKSQQKEDLKTIKDIAEEANVSPGTVDRVLHNRGGVSKKTAEKIKLIVSKNNFKINKVASSLALNKSFKIATLIPGFNDENVFWKAPLTGINKAQEEVEVFGAKVLNFTFDQFNTSSYLNQFKALLDCNPDAVILVPSFKKETQLIISELEAKNIPYIFLNIDLKQFNNISFIGQDSYTSGYLAGKLMHLCVQKKCSVVIMRTRSNMDNSPAISTRIKGFTDYFSNNEIPVSCLEIDIFDLDNTDELREKLSSIFKNNPAIKGMFVPNSRISIFANCVEDLKIQKISSIGFDATEQNIKCLKEDKLSFLISQKPFKQGYDSIKLMTDYLIEKKLPLAKIYSPIEILTKENVDFS